MSVNSKYWSLILKSWKYSINNKKQFVAVYFMFILCNLLLTLNPIIYGRFINSFKEKNTNLNDTILYVSLTLVLTVIGCAIHAPAHFLERKLAYIISRNFLLDIYKKSLSLSVEWHNNYHSGNKVGQIKKSYEALNDFFRNGFMFTNAVCRLVFSSVAMIYLSPFWGGIGTAIGLVTIYIILLFDKKFIERVNELNIVEGKLSTLLFDNMTNITTIISLRLEDKIYNDFKAKINSILPSFLKTVSTNELQWFIVTILTAIIYSSVVFGYVNSSLKLDNSVNLAELVTMIGYVNQFTSVFQSVALQYADIVKYETEANNVEFIFSEFEKKLRNVDAYSLNKWKFIQFDNISFSHRLNLLESNNYFALKNVCFQIKQTNKIAIIGDSGSGKSTLLKVMANIYNCDTANVNIDNMHTVNLKKFSTNITLINQDIEIFENTFLYNLTLGLPFDELQIKNICSLLCLDELIDSLPEGIHTDIREKGFNFSGGQKQRINLARGLLLSHEREIILMDEPTCSLDQKTELVVYENIFEQYNSKTFIVSVHRLDILYLFDYIYVMKEGYFIDKGTFLSLNNRYGFFNY